MTERLKKSLQAALFAALVCVATMLVHIPMPATNGYINAGDAVVFTAAFWLGPAYAPLAAGLGSALADLFLGYAVYIPGTFVIKGLEALFAALLYRALRGKTKLAPVPCAIAGGLWMAGGYLLYEALFLGFGAAALGSLPGNLFQAAGGVVLCFPLIKGLDAAANRVRK